MSKKCNTCGEEKSPEDFYKGYNRCKICQRAYAKAYREANPLKIKEYSHKHYMKNRDNVLERTGKYQKEHREQVRGYALKYRNNNLERCRTNSREYNRENYTRLAEYSQKWFKEHRAEYNLRERARRARLRELDGYHTVEDLDDAYLEQLGKCVYCKRPLEETGISVDHIIPITREGSSDYAYNIQLLCKSCNSSKNNRTHEEFLQYLELRKEAA